MNKYKAIEIIINDFIEPKLDGAELMKNSRVMKALEKLFFNEQSLPGNKNKEKEKLINLNNSPKYVFKNLKFEDIFEDSKSDRIETFKRQMLLSHGIMRHIWKQLKEAIKYKLDPTDPNCNPPVTLCEVKVSLGYATDNVQCGYDGIVLKFINHLDGIPFNMFRNCEKDGCDKWYASTTIKKKYCSEKCANNARQTRHKKKDPGGYKKYHRNYQKKKYKEECDSLRQKEILW